MSENTDNDAEISCKELTELVTEYLEETMTPARRARFESHVGECPPCLEHLDQMKLTVRAVGRVSESTISPEARDALMANFRDWTRD